VQVLAQHHPLFSLIPWLVITANPLMYCLMWLLLCTAQLLVAIDRDHLGHLLEAQVLGKLSCRFGPLTEYYDDNVME
jgi:hypothetical protein